MKTYGDWKAQRDVRALILQHNINLKPSELVGFTKKEISTMRTGINGNLLFDISEVQITSYTLTEYEQRWEAIGFVVYRTKNGKGICGSGCSFVCTYDGRRFCTQWAD